MTFVVEVYGERGNRDLFPIYVVRLYKDGKLYGRGWFALSFRSAIRKGEKEIVRAQRRLEARR